MGYFKCEVCDEVYGSETCFNGFECIHCPGKVIETTESEYEDLMARNFEGVEYTTASC